MGKERTVKAAVCYEYGKPLVIEDIKLEPPGKGEVTIRVAATAICHSDIHSIKGEHGLVPLPALAGHETSGWVEEVGEGVTYVKPGDLVVYSLMTSGCGHCYYCNIGQADHCTNHPVIVRKPGRALTSRGERMYHFYGTMGTFAEYATGSEYNLTKVPDDTPPELGALLSCGVIAGWGAVVNRAKVTPNSSVVVVGAGGVGLNAIQGAYFSGAYPIIAVDVNDTKLEAAKAFGATFTINSRTEENPVKKAKELTYGRGADFVIVAVAGADVLRQAWNMSAGTGMTVIVGHGFEETLEEWHPVEFCGGRMMTGSVMGAFHPRWDIPRMLELYKAGRLKLDELVSGHYSLDQINEAIASSEKGDVMRNIITFQA